MKPFHISKNPDTAYLKARHTIVVSLSYVVYYNIVLRPDFILVYLTFSYYVNRWQSLFLQILEIKFVLR